MTESTFDQGSLTVANKKRNDVSVKIDANVHRKLRTVAAWKEQDMAEYLSKIVDIIVSRELQKMGSEFADDEPEQGDE